MNYTEEQIHIIDAANRFCDEDLTEEKVCQWVKSRGVPQKVNDHFREGELGSYCLRSGDVGTSCSMLGRATLVEQITRRAGATVPFLSIMLSMVLLSSMRKLSQQEITDELLSKTGWIGFSQAFSESNAGIDASAVETTVTTDGDSIFLDGEKTFVSSGQFLPETLVLAHDPVFGCADGGLALWLVPIDAPGVSTYPLNTVGQEMLAPAIVRFDQVRLDPKWQIQAEGKLDAMLKRQYEYGRILVCASSLGLARAAAHDAMEYAAKHMIKGRRTGSIPQIQEKLAEMETKIRAMRMFVYDAARSADTTDDGFHLDCAIMKRYVPQAATDVASTALQVFGGRGYTDETRIGRIWKDCRGNQIAQGTDEVMARVISKYLISNQAGLQA